MILDGILLADLIKKKLKKEIETFPRKPKLTFILVGDDPASKTYVKMKKKGCREVGIHSKVYELAKTLSEMELLKLITQENKNPDTDGILVQMPLPSQIDPQKIFVAVDPTKDVDGFHPINMGKLLLGAKDCFTPCTPKGILTLMDHYKIEIVSKRIVILGRSNIVGKPLMAALIQKDPKRNATVTLVHSQSKEIETMTCQADILIAAMGKKQSIQKEMVKKGAVVIDVGISRIAKNGQNILVGDVDFENVKPVVSMITPVPGGVGPMTIVSLLENTVKSYLYRCNG